MEMSNVIKQCGLFLSSKLNEDKQRAPPFTTEPEKPGILL